MGDKPKTTENPAEFDAHRFNNDPHYAAAEYMKTQETLYEEMVKPPISDEHLEAQKKLRTAYTNQMLTDIQRNLEAWENY